jgi:NAD(P)-dependent dehydrogenase (short-subunit alcohol dehydrogenase family)
VPIRLDLTDRATIVDAVRLAPDVTLLINNAGIRTCTPILGDEAGLRQELDVNYLGPVAVTRNFAPVLAANGGGALVNVLSVLSWVSWVTAPHLGGYSAAKSAMWAATNALRLTLAEQNTLVVAVHVGYMDTDMAAAVTAPKSAPRYVAQAILDALEASRHELLADEPSRRVRAQLSGPLTAMYPSLNPQAAA